MDRTKYLAAMAARGRKCAADVLATGTHLDLVRSMLDLAQDRELESILRRRVLPDEWAAAAEQSEP